jgi:hypothetical protein
MAATRPADESTGASTLLEVLGQVAQEGFSAQLVVTDDGRFRCTRCGTVQPISEFDVAGFRRLEGASDPSDMLIVVWGACPGCGGGGVATIGYGPNASDADVAALEQLDLRDRS